MPKRITQLTDEQKAQMAPWAQKWIQVGHRTGPADLDTFTDAARRCYQFAGIPWHSNVVRVPSPLVGVLAAPIAAYLIALHRGQPVGDAVDGAVRGAVDGAVRDAVRGAVRDAVDDAVDAAVDGAVDAAVRGAVHSAVGGAVRGAVRGAVDDAVDDAVGGAVGGAVGDAVRDVIRQLYYYRLGGQWWINWQAYYSFFRDVCGLELDGDMWDRSRAYEDAQSAGGWWWPFRDFVMVADRPTELHLEQAGPIGWGSHRLHCAAGPAVAWSDGWSLHFWHGLQVPAWVVESPTVELIAAAANSEVRRCGIESMGWPEFVRTAGLALVDEADDPGNPGQRIGLYDVPEQLWGDQVRVLLCTNGTVERGGVRRKFGLTVPPDTPTALAASGWGYSLTGEQYATAARRT